MMAGRRSINAISVGSHALRVLRGGATGEVHSTFERAFNALISDELVGITRSDVPNGPFSVITDVKLNEGMQSLVDNGEGIKVDADFIYFRKGLVISLKGAKIWWPQRGVKKPIYKKLVKRNLSLVKEIASHRNDGFGGLVRHIEKIIYGTPINYDQLNHVSRSGLPSIISLVGAVKTEDLALVGQSTKNLVGLGPGLTPSGDDLLAGFMASLRWAVNSFNGDLDSVDEINRTIANAAKGTTMMSEQIIARAVDGEVDETVEGLLEAVLNGQIEDVKDSTEKVLALGETSGVDSIVGILIGSLLGIET
jgi:hypothetical protein